MFPLEWYNYAEIGAFLVSLFLWPKLRKTRLWVLLPYLAFIVCLELVSRYLGRELKMNIGWIFNFTIPLEIIFYTYLFYLHFDHPRLKQFAWYFMQAMAAFALVFNLLYWTGDFQSVFLRISTISMIILSCLYFIDMLRREVPVDVLAQPMFWVAVGLIIFNAGELALSLFFDPLKSNMVSWRRIYRLINNNLNIFLYLMLSIGAIVAVWRRKPAS